MYFFSGLLSQDQMLLAQFPVKEHYSCMVKVDCSRSFSQCTTLFPLFLSRPVAMGEWNQKDIVGSDGLLSPGHQLGFGGGMAYNPLYFIVVSNHK